MADRGLRIGERARPGRCFWRPRRNPLPHPKCFIIYPSSRSLVVGIDIHLQLTISLASLPVFLNPWSGHSISVVDAHQTGKRTSQTGLMRFEAGTIEPADPARLP